MSENKDKQYQLKLDPNYYVVESNALIKGKQRMSLREAQLLYITIAQIVKEDKDFKTYTTPVTALAEFMNIEADSLYRDLESICTSLLQRVVKLNVEEANNPRDKKWKAFQWVSYASYANGRLTIRLNDELKPYLIELVSKYSQSLLGTLCAFNRYYTARLYQYIVCEIGEHPRVPKREWSFTCEEIRDFYQIKKDEYTRPNDLIRKTIKAALTELNSSEFAYIWDYEELHGPGRGRPLTGVKFKARIFQDIDDKKAYFDENEMLSFEKRKTKK